MGAAPPAVSKTRHINQCKPCRQHTIRTRPNHRNCVRDNLIHLGLSGGTLDFPERQPPLSFIRQKFIGRFILVVVAFLYGTLNVCLRRVYSLPNAPSAPALSATRGLLAALCFLHVPFQKKNSQSKKRSDNETIATSESTTERTIQPSRQLLWLTAFDLAIWNFLAQGLINIGLMYVPAARASFLTQSSVIFTPLLSLGVGHSIPLSLWLGVGLAFVGLCILSSSGGDATMAAAATAGTMTATHTVWDMIRQWWNSIHPGDGLVLAGAISWSIYLLRLSRASSPDNNKYRIQFPALPLQAIKTLLLAVMYTCWWAINSCVKTTTTAPGQAWWNSGTAWFWLGMSAIGPGALADVLQQRGQQHVSAAEANVILSTESVFSAVCGFLLLGETVERRDMTGGTMILVAALLSSLSSS